MAELPHTHSLYSLADETLLLATKDPSLTKPTFYCHTSCRIALRLVLPLSSQHRRAASPRLASPTFRQSADC